MWRLSHLTDASTWGNQCEMRLLSYGEPCARYLLLQKLKNHSLIWKFSFSSWKPSSYFPLRIFSYLAYENIYCILTSICFTFFQQDLTLRFEFPPHLPQKKNRKKEICCFRADEECLLCGRKKKHLVDVNLCRLDCGTFMKVIFVIETPKLSVWSDLFFACLKHFNFC